MWGLGISRDRGAEKAPDPFFLFSRRLLKANNAKEILEKTIKIGLGERTTVKLPATKYRRLMAVDFDRDTYGQRWQCETVFSMIKRNFSDSLSGCNYWSQCRDMILLVLTHNLGIILLAKELFYRALLTPFFSPDPFFL